MDWVKVMEAAHLLAEYAKANGARPTGNVTVGELLDEFHAAKLRAGRSLRYLRQMRVAARALLGKRKRPLAAVSRQVIENALATLPLAPRTRRGYLADVRTLLTFAVRREWLARNPAAFIDAPFVVEGPPGIHTPAQVRAILEAARRSNPDLCRALAVRYFTGLRSAEAQRLTEADLRIDQGVVEVVATKAKTRRRRIVPIPPNLREWLALGGRLPLSKPSGKCARVARLAGVPWPHNVTRHSWASYHLAAHGNAARTALEAGHSEQMLFAHYRELVTPEAAREFFGIRPENGQMELKLAV